MTLEAKRAAITAFVVGIDRLRDEVRDDAIDMMAACPVEILGDADALELFLLEMMEALTSRHLVTPKGKIRPAAATLIRSYVRGMSA